MILSTLLNAGVQRKKLKPLRNNAMLCDPLAQVGRKQLGSLRLWVQSSWPSQIFEVQCPKSSFRSAQREELNLKEMWWCGRECLGLKNTWCWVQYQHMASSLNLQWGWAKVFWEKRPKAAEVLLMVKVFFVGKHTDLFTSDWISVSCWVTCVWFCSR